MIIIELNNNLELQLVFSKPLLRELENKIPTLELMLIVESSKF